MRWLALGAAGRGRDGGRAGPPQAPAARARTGSVAGPVAGLSRDLPVASLVTLLPVLLPASL